ncbi:cilia- and flagella-associated protein 70-like [Myzus persicae]|uniref:cilia- and flagella-associated protein 70-like n=1 Tax=Myzus persicae TaxID=13164 RepID=UPI000B935082|nr:cilia- and flagella-associated protein 70-like [Myzus persicae]
MAVCEYKKGNYLASLEHLKSDKLIEKYKKVTDVLKFLNDIELNEQLDIFENDLLHIIYSETPCEELHLIYLKGAMHCYKNKFYIKGVEICQIACTVLRTPMILTLLAKCLIQIGELETAESALDEANVMDIKNEEVWAYLTVVNIKMGNADEAKMCYMRALEETIEQFLGN